MYPTRIDWHDVACFKGQHRLDLKSAVHAVTARHVDDAGRSNWLGKSTLLGLIPFALFGWHMKRTDDELISKGAQSCGVKLTLSDGSIVERSKEHGKPVQIRFTVKPSGAVLTQKAAQAAIERHIGLTAEDYFATCHFEQKQLARLVTARAGDRVDIIEGWLHHDIDPIQRMHSRALVELSGLIDQHVEAEAGAQRIADEANAMIDSYGIDQGAKPCGAVASMDDVVAARQADADAAKAKVDRLQLKAQKRAEWEAQARDAARFDEVVAEGKALKMKVDALAGADDRLKAADAKLAEATASVVDMRRELTRIERLDCGDFDGQCPVTGGACPAADEVRRSGPAAGVLDELRWKLNDCDQAQGKAGNDRTDAARDARERAQGRAHLAALRAEARRLKPAADAIARRGQPPTADAVQSRLSNARIAETEAFAALHEAKSNRDWLAEASADAAKLRAKAERLKADIDLHREAVAILGREGAQKRVASLALGQIEDGANALLRAAGVALGVRFIWAREGKGMAKQCGDCGAPFPASARAKQCPRCGAVRGPHMIAKLDIELTNSSGAADDLAGIAVQLAASNWLRLKRGTPWAAVCIDEPFGALDRTNRNALAVHVATMLRDRFDLALVVAHDRAILDALPAQVAIVADASGSSLERLNDGTKQTPGSNPRDRDVRSCDVGARPSRSDKRRRTRRSSRADTGSDPVARKV